MKTLVQMLCCVLILGASNSSWADLPRPPGWEPTCSLEKELQSGGPCDQCRGWQNPDPCQEALEKKGYTRRCEEGGAGSYVAVWCQSPRTATPASSTTPPSVAPSGSNRRGGGMCGVYAVGSNRDAYGLGLATVVTAIGLEVMRRRARRRAN